MSSFFNAPDAEGKPGKTCSDSFFGYGEYYQGLVLSIEDMYNDIKDLNIDSELEDIRKVAEEVEKDRVEVAENTQKVEGLVVESKSYSDESKSYSEKSSKSATLSAESATSAEGSFDKAQLEADRSEHNADLSQNHADQAKIHADNAKSSEDSAKESEEEAKRLLEEFQRDSVYRGAWNPMSNAYPPRPPTNSRWDVYLDDGTISYVFGGNTWYSGDRLLFSLADNTFYRIGSFLGVVSVNGKTGTVTLNSGDVGSYSKAEVDALLTTSGEVKSVNGKTGVVVLNAEDVGALPTTGGTVSGQLILEQSDDAFRLKSEENKAGFISGYSGDNRKWWFGRGSSSSDDLSINNEVHATNFVMKSDRTEFNKPVYVSDKELATKEYVDQHSGGSGAVDSVNGQTGVVILDAEDVGALPVTKTGSTWQVDDSFRVKGTWLQANNVTFSGVTRLRGLEVADDAEVAGEIREQGNRVFSLNNLPTNVNIDYGRI